MYISRKTKANSFPVNREVSFSEFSPCFCYCLVISNKIKIIRKVIGSFSLSSLFRASTSSIIFVFFSVFSWESCSHALLSYTNKCIVFLLHQLVTCLSLHKRFFSGIFLFFAHLSKDLVSGHHHSINVSAI